MEKSFTNTSIQVDSLPYPFERDDIDNFKSVLQGISDYFGVHVDADDLIAHYLIDRMEGSTF